MSDGTRYLFRPDLIVSQQETGFVIMDPVRQTFVRLGISEMLVAQQFDGASSLEEVRERLREERDVEAPIESLRRFLERLRELQLVTAPNEPVAPRTPDLAVAYGRWERLFFIRLPLDFDPDELLDRLTRRTRSLFSRWFAALVVAVGLAALAILLVHGGDLWSQLPGLTSPGGALTVLAVIAVSVIIHELAHGLAAKASGVRVPRMGIFLHYFLPAFYTDISGTWLLPSKRQRALVIAAGPTATLTLLSLATLAWWLVPAGGFAGQLALAFMAVNAFGTGRTLIPFLQGDGYHLLSNQLDRPNLRHKALAYGYGLLRQLLPGHGRAVAPTVTPGEHWGYLMYAAGAVISSLLLAIVGFAVLAWCVLAFTGASVG